MPALKSTAIVLRVVEFSESSCVVTLFTRDYGKISALAKGARRPKSPFEAALDLLAVCRIVFLQKPADALDLLTEAKLDRRFRSASNHLSRLYAGYYVAELLSELTDDGDPHPSLYEQADQTLLAIDDKGQDFERSLFRFEMMALRILGHHPSLQECVDCGTPMPVARRVAFAEAAGGVLCAACRHGKRQVISVSYEVIEYLRELVEPQSDRWRSNEFPQKVRGETRAVLNRYLCHLLGRRPKMHAYLNQLAH